MGLGGTQRFALLWGRGACEYSCGAYITAKAKKKKKPDRIYGASASGPREGDGPERLDNQRTAQTSLKRFM
jgi:hypothetical protein